MKIRSVLLAVLVFAWLGACVATVHIEAVQRVRNCVENRATVSVQADGLLQRLQDQSVRVDISCGPMHGSGSGVIVTRQVGEVRRTFIWTAGHVAQVLRNKDGTFRNATIHQEWRGNGAFKCESAVEAKVISYSDPELGEDLALLEVLQDNFSPLSVSATFMLNDDIPSVGTELIHVGSTLGIYNSVSLGIVSQTDRDLLKTGKVFDQTTCMGYPGSSGGGVYLASDGRCIGLLVRGVGPGLNFVTPARRMLVWSKKMRVEWAMDPSIAVPTHWNMREPTPLTDGTEMKADTQIEALIKAIKAALGKVQSPRKGFVYGPIE